MLKSVLLRRRGTSGRSPCATSWGARHRRFQSEPLALVGKVYAWLWFTRLPSQRSPREGVPKGTGYRP